MNLYKLAKKANQRPKHTQQQDTSDDLYESMKPEQTEKKKKMIKKPVASNHKIQ
jgi:hypothetical protein